VVEVDVDKSGATGGTKRKLRQTTRSRAFYAAGSASQLISVAWRPVRRLQWHDHFAALRQACEYTIRFVGVRHSEHQRKAARSFIVARQRVAARHIESSGTQPREPDLVTPFWGHFPREGRLGIRQHVHDFAAK
jgi:hypothetical protein